MSVCVCVFALVYMDSARVCVCVSGKLAALTV